MKDWEIIADNLSKGRMELGLCLSDWFQTGKQSLLCERTDCWLRLVTSKPKSHMRRQAVAACQAMLYKLRYNSANCLSRLFSAVFSSNKLFAVAPTAATCNEPSRFTAWRLFVLLTDLWNRPCARVSRSRCQFHRKRESLHDEIGCEASRSRCFAENLYRMLEIEFLTVSCFVFIMFDTAV